VRPLAMPRSVVRCKLEFVSVAANEPIASAPFNADICRLIRYHVGFAGKKRQGFAVVLRNRAKLWRKTA
jgi:hypothetical protein